MIGLYMSGSGAFRKPEKPNLRRGVEVSEVRMLT